MITDADKREAGEFDVPEHPGRWIIGYHWKSLKDQGPMNPPPKWESMQATADYIRQLESEAAEHTRWVMLNAVDKFELQQAKEALTAERARALERERAAFEAANIPAKYGGCYGNNAYGRKYKTFADYEKARDGR